MSRRTKKDKTEAISNLVGGNGPAGEAAATARSIEIGDAAGESRDDGVDLAVEERRAAFSPDVEETDEDLSGDSGASDDFDDAEADADDDDVEVIVFDADREDAAEAAAALRRAAEAEDADGGVAPGGGPREMAELIRIIESLVFVSEEPLPVKTIAEVLKEERGWIQVAVEDLAKEFNERNGGLMLREVAGGWQFATRPEHHEHVRAYLKSRPSAKLSLAALETLAVIAYKQPITVPEILEIRGVQSSSAIKTLLDKRLIVAKGRKETVGRPMMYGTSKEFLLQFGLKDLTELPNVEDFEDLTSGGA
jgi:segregation and condensation protein B